MAWDESLLENVAPCGQPILRFYAWNEPAATFGYSQHFRDIASWTQLRPLIRRPTGGGLVPHDADWTYSLAFPPGHFWYELPAVESYRLVHQWIHAALTSLGVPTQLAAVPSKPAPGRCFIGAEKHDLLRDGAKIAGAAQRRNRQGLLIQGSIQPGPGLAARRADWEEAMRETTRFPCGQIHWKPLIPDERWAARVMQLEHDKYSQSSYNERR